MAKALVVITRALDHPDADSLLTAMTLELGDLYGFTGPLRGTLAADQFLPPEGRLLVGYVGAAPTAVGGYRKVEVGLGQVHRVYVRPEARGEGFGRRLMERLEAMAFVAGYRTLRLDTGSRQPAAAALYENLGYQRIPRFAPYEEQPGVLCYAKRLAS